MNAALEACPREGGDRLNGLRLKEAFALLKEGEVEAANCLVSTLRISPHLEKEVGRFYDEAGLSSRKVVILEQRLSAKLEEISGDSPSIAEALCIFHQLLIAELHPPKLDATHQSLISLKAEHETLAKLGQQTSIAMVAQDARIQRLEEQAQRKEAKFQETLASLRAEVEALTEELVKAGEEIKRMRAQNAQIQRLDKKLNKSEAATQECLTSIRAELRALLEKAARSEEEAKRIQSSSEWSQKVEVAQQTLNSLVVDFETLQDIYTSRDRLAQAQYQSHISQISSRIEAVKYELVNFTVYLRVKNFDYLSRWHLLDICVREINENHFGLEQMHDSDLFFAKIKTQFHSACREAPKRLELSSLERTSLSKQFDEFFNNYREVCIAGYVFRKLITGEFIPAIIVLIMHLNSSDPITPHRRLIIDSSKVLALRLCSHTMQMFYSGQADKVRDK
jgi:DNA repair exonuclease SbcCD ATPase subunit